MQPVDDKTRIVCRICLAQKPPGEDGLKTFIMVSEKVNNQRVSDIIKNLAGISCFTNKNCADEVCRSCARNISNALATKNRCLKSDMTLSKTRQNKKDPCSLNGVTIKLVKCEPDLPSFSYEQMIKNSSKVISARKNTLHRTNVKRKPPTDSDSDSDFSDDDTKQFEEKINQISKVIETLTQLLPNVKNGTGTLLPEMKVEKKIQKRRYNEVFSETLFCCKCSELFRDRKQLVDHFTKMHLEKIHSEPIEPENPNQCHLCRKTFPDAKSLDKHQKRIYFTAQRYERYRLTKPENQCSVCTHVYAQHASKELCERRHAGLERISCPRPGCDKTLKNRANLLGHLKLHDFPDLLPIHCEFCGKKFRNIGSLNAHAQMHNQLKPFECAICEKKFKRKKCVEIHMRVHTGERPYQCTVCPNNYMHYTDLKRHEMIHTGQRPYKCQFPDCNKGFTKRSSLQSHEKSHNILD